MHFKQIARIFAGVAGVALAGGALGAPRENATWTNVNSASSSPGGGVSNHLGSTGVETRTLVATGTYNVQRINFTGTFTGSSTATWASDARVLVTAPNGMTFVITPFPGVQTFTGARNASLSVGLPAPVNATGTWSFKFYELYQDSAGGAADGVWSTASAVLDDAPGANPPFAATTFGTLAVPSAQVTRQANVALGTVVWATMTLTTPITVAAGNWLDVDTQGSINDDGFTPMDTQMAVYSQTGALIASNNDSPGTTLRSSYLSFGAKLRTDAAGNGLPTNGRDGELRPGVYYIACAVNNTTPATTFNQNFSVTGANQGIGGNLQIRIRTGSNGTIPAPVVNGTIADRFMAASAPAETIPLAPRFTYNKQFPVIRMRFVRGPGTGTNPDIANVDIALNSARNPLTVNNFLNYVLRPASLANSSQNTVLHRSINNFVLQGGGYRMPTVVNTAPTLITTDPPVLNEFGLSNTRGSIAMAKFGFAAHSEPTFSSVNSATSQFFLSTADNSSNLDFQNGGFTVFGRVVNGTMSNVETLANIPTFSLGGSFTDVPLIDVPPVPQDLELPFWVNMLSVTQLTPAQLANVDFLYYEATSSNPTIVVASVINRDLVITPLANQTGSVTITVRAVTPDGTSASTSFIVRRACGKADVAAVGGALNADGQLTVDDIIAYLNAFFAMNLSIADLTQVGGVGAPDGQITADDLILFLSAFFNTLCP